MEGELTSAVYAAGVSPPHGEAAGAEHAVPFCWHMERQARGEAVLRWWRRHAARAYHQLPEERKEREKRKEKNK